MTREDINDIIKTLCPNDEDFEKPIISPAYLKKELEALALEQKSCEDCVSRAKLLKKFEDRFIELQKAHKTDKQLGVNWCINTLKELPSVTPTTCIAKVVFDKDELQKMVDEKVKELVTHGTCKDCKHNKNGICPNYRHFVDDDFYCADFEKRGN